MDIDCKSFPAKTNGTAKSINTRAIVAKKPEMKGMIVVMKTITTNSFIETVITASALVAVMESTVLIIKIIFE